MAEVVSEEITSHRDIGPPVWGVLGEKQQKRHKGMWRRFCKHLVKTFVLKRGCLVDLAVAGVAVCSHPHPPARPPTPLPQVRTRIRPQWRNVLLTIPLHLQSGLGEGAY